MPTNKHSVFVLSIDGEPLTPTTPAKAKKLLKAGAAVKHWSKFGIFGIKLTTKTRTFTPGTVQGLRKGLLVGLKNGKTGRLCGETGGSFYYHKEGKKRGLAKKLVWISSNFITRKGVAHSSQT